MIDEVFVEKVKALRAKGKTQEEIAVEMRVAQGTISRVLREHGLGGHLIKRKKLAR